jgi:hypothetical protein
VPMVTKDRARSPALIPCLFPSPSCGPWCYTPLRPNDDLHRARKSTRETAPATEDLAGRAIGVGRWWPKPSIKFTHLFSCRLNESGTLCRAQRDARVSESVAARGEPTTHHRRALGVWLGVLCGDRRTFLWGVLVQGGVQHSANCLPERKHRLRPRPPWSRPLLLNPVRFFAHCFVVVQIACRDLR